jgi:hypothetical protein
MKRPTVCVTCVWAGVDSLWEQKKLEARKMLENAAESHTSGARFVGQPCAYQNDSRKKTTPPTRRIFTHNLIFGNYQKRDLSKCQLIKKSTSTKTKLTQIYFFSHCKADSTS